METIQTIDRRGVEPILVLYGNAISSKNSRPIYSTAGGRPFIGKSSKLSAQMKSYHTQCLAAKRGFLKATEGEEKPIKLLFHFCRKTKQRFDYSNIVQGVADALVASGLITDDNSEEMMPFYSHEYDAKNPRVEVYLVRSVSLAIVGKERRND
jgi:Holliday junction resolvase RusA-like endonuclease